MGESSMDETKTFNRNKWFYSLGGIGRDMAYQLFAAYLLTYVMFTRTLTDAQFFAISIIMIVCRIWDAINDPVMGGIIENTKMKLGKFKPWIIIGAVTSAVVMVIYFSSGFTGWNFVVFFGILYLLFDITFTMNDISYWAMLPSLAKDQNQRATLTSMANLFAAIGAIIAFAAIPILTNGSMAIGGNSITGYRAVAIIIGLIFIGCQAMTTFCVKEAPVSYRPNNEKIGFKAMINVVLKNDQLLWTSLEMLLYNLGSSLINVFGIIYVYMYFGYDGINITLFVGAYALGSLLVNIVYPAMAKHLSRSKIAVLGLIGVILGYGFFFIIGIAIPMIYLLLCVAGLLLAFGQSMIYMVITINLTNCIEYNEYKKGNRDEAIIFSIRPFMAKMGSALEQGIVAAAYLLLGITAITNGISEAEQLSNMGQIDAVEKSAMIDQALALGTDSMKMNFRCIIVFVPIFLIGCAFLVMQTKNKVDEKEYDRMIGEITAKKAQIPTDK
jgi:melibiose permease/lactose/raffinose/galactose permease